MSNVNQAEFFQKKSFSILKKILLERMNRTLSILSFHTDVLDNKINLQLNKK